MIEKSIAKFNGRQNFPIYGIIATIKTVRNDLWTFGRHAFWSMQAHVSEVWVRYTVDSSEEWRKFSTVKRGEAEAREPDEFQDPNVKPPKEGEHRCAAFENKGLQSTRHYPPAPSRQGPPFFKPVSKKYHLQPGGC